MNVSRLANVYLRNTKVFPWWVFSSECLSHCAYRPSSKYLMHTHKLTREGLSPVQDFQRVSLEHKLLYTEDPRYANYASLWGCRTYFIFLMSISGMHIFFWWLYRAHKNLSVNVMHTQPRDASDTHRLSNECQRHTQAFQWVSKAHTGFPSNECIRYTDTIQWVSNV